LTASRGTPILSFEWGRFGRIVGNPPSGISRHPLAPATVARYPFRWCNRYVHSANQCIYSAPTDRGCHEDFARDNSRV